MAIRVLVADDHEVVRMGLKALLTGQDVEVVGIAKSGTEVLEVIDTLNPDVVMLDVRMPDDEGLQTLEVLRQKSPELGVIKNRSFSQVITGPIAGAFGDETAHK